MNINEQAIEAAAGMLPGIPENSHEAFLMRATARAALEAAVPYIRKQIAERALRDAIEAVEDAGLDAYTANEVAIWLNDRVQKLTEES